MKLHSILPYYLVALATANPFLQRKQEDDTTTKAPFFLLAGDSTTAPNGGWGDGFLENTLEAPASGLNYGHSGTTTVSFRAGGDWDEVLAEIVTHKDEFDVYVTIQFGHNDQKGGSGITIEDFKENLGVFVDEVRDSGGEPILVTSLTRRVFDDGTVVQSLANERAAAIEVAEAKESKFIDLNIASEEYCDAIGEAESYEFNLYNATRYGDRTHLNAWGGVVFGRLVSDLLVEKYAEVFEEWTVKNETLSEALREGVPPA